MSKYIDADKLIAEIKRLKARAEAERVLHPKTILSAKNYLLIKDYDALLDTITSLQQEQPNGKQVIIITETDGDANIHWDCRSLEDVRALLACAESYISDKQNAELRGKGSGSDYNTTEGRFRNAHKSQQEQPEVDLKEYLSAKLSFLGSDLIRHKPYSFNRGLNVGMTKAYSDILKKINARKEDEK